MCGIVGYVGGRPCRDLLIAGLEKLEYRGYDSAGISLLVDGRIETVRAVGNLANLRAAVSNGDCNGGGAIAEAPSTIGLAHTRWATHGRVTEQNAHPHGDCEDRIHIVLNGIVENHADLRRELQAEGHRFSSETDAEIVAHLIERHDDGDLTEAVRRAFNAQTRKVTLIENGEIVTLDSEGVAITDTGGQPVSRDVEEVTWDEDAAEKSGFPTFMLKEIHEQPDAVAETIADRLPELDRVDLSELELDPDYVAGLRRVVIVACGTAYHAGLVGRYAIEQWARVPVEMDIASEYRYRDPVVGPEDLVIGITQSGETADTLAAMRLARERGAKVMAITNIMGSQATRDSDGVLYTRAGLEIGVAATKTFLAEVATMYLIGLKLAGLRRALGPDH